jgi:hypothetical protein
MVPDTLKLVSFIEKDFKRFPETNGWAYAGVVHMWTAPSLQDVCSALIGSLASICPACWCART